MSLIVPFLLRCFAVSPAPTFSLRGAVGRGVLRSLRRVAVVVSAPASFTLGFPDGTVAAPAGGLAVRAGGLAALRVALPSWLLSALLRALVVSRVACVSCSARRCWANPALNLAPFGRWTLRDKAAQRRLALRWASQ
ncbi:MAG: hypothetical protein NDI67_08240 [Sulfuritalea sp.]|nr:hypothetical protein [Sulfuritalea sp.]